MKDTIPVTLLEFLNYSVKLLNQKKVKDARLNVELMLCDVLKCERVNLYLNFEKPLSKDEIKKFKEYLKRRLTNEPLQYVLGKTSFYGLDFVVNKSVLIPRPETELLVEKLLADIMESKKERVSVFEIGSGSGCISIALAKNLETKSIEYNIFSIDISGEAIEVANQNLKMNNLESNKIKFFKKDVFEIDKLTKTFHYIISNPPYISHVELKKLEPEVKDFEPDIALTDFSNGMKFYEKIFSIAADKHFTGKLFCEVGFGQRPELEIQLRQNNFTDYSFYKDYSGTDRILEARK